MAQLSQINRIRNVLIKNSDEGITVSKIASTTKVPKGNILSHIAMLRKRFGENAVVTERRTLEKTGKRKVYFKATKALEAERKADKDEAPSKSVRHSRKKVNSESVAA